MTARRPYVDRPVADRRAAESVAHRAAAMWGLPAPELLRHGMNSLYACDDVVLRVGATTAPAATSHELVTRLIDRGIATVPPVEGLAADLDGLAVTGWRYVASTGADVDWATVGAIVRRVHRLTIDDVPSRYPVPDPSTFPWWDFEALLDDTADRLDGRARQAIADAIERHADWADRAREEPVVCHGDVHPGNVLMSADGPLLIDWDLLCVAHPAWDHAMLTTYASRWGGDAGAYSAFASGYGGELADEQLVDAIAELRNVAATLMRVKAGRADPAARHEAEQRLRYWRGDPDAPTWRAQ